MHVIRQGLSLKRFSLPVYKQILGQPFCTNDFKNNFISLQSLEMYPTRQSWVKALGKALPYDQPLWQEGVAEVTLQGLEYRLETLLINKVYPLSEKFGPNI